MKKFSKVFLTAMVSVALVGAFALVGCSSSNNAASSASSSKSSAATASGDKVELQIFAANSLSKAMDEVQALYTESHPNVTFADTQYKSSGELNELLKGGATADIEITASKANMDAAAEAGYIDTNTRFDMFKNDLVMVTGENSAITECTLEDIAAGKYTVGIGDESVPAGNYACQSLSTVGCYTSADGTTGKDSTGKGGTFSGALADSSKVQLQTSVGNVCKLAQAGDVEIAFVYTSDVYRFGGVKIVGTVPADTHKNIIYPAAVTSMAGDKAAAADEFLKWAVSDEEALKVWQKWGFELAA